MATAETGSLFLTMTVPMLGSVRSIVPISGVDFVHALTRDSKGVHMLTIPDKYTT